MSYLLYYILLCRQLFFFAMIAFASPLFSGFPSLKSEFLWIGKEEWDMSQQKMRFFVSFCWRGVVDTVLLLHARLSQQQEWHPHLGGLLSGWHCDALWIYSWPAHHIFTAASFSIINQEKQKRKKKEHGAHGAANLHKRKYAEGQAGCQKADIKLWSAPSGFPDRSPGAAPF